MAGPHGRPLSVPQPLRAFFISFTCLWELGVALERISYLFMASYWIFYPQLLAYCRTLGLKLALFLYIFVLFGLKTDTADLQHTPEIRQHPLRHRLFRHTQIRRQGDPGDLTAAYRMNQPPSCLYITNAYDAKKMGRPRVGVGLNRRILAELFGERLAVYEIDRRTSLLPQPTRCRVAPTE